MKTLAEIITKLNKQSRTVDYKYIVVNQSRSRGPKITILIPAFMFQHVTFPFLPPSNTTTEQKYTA